MARPTSKASRCSQRLGQRDQWRGAQRRQPARLDTQQPGARLGRPGDDAGALRLQQLAQRPLAGAGLEHDEGIGRDGRGLGGRQALVVRHVVARLQPQAQQHRHRRPLQAQGPGHPARRAGRGGGRLQLGTQFREPGLDVAALRQRIGHVQQRLHRALGRQLVAAGLALQQVALHLPRLFIAELAAGVPGQQGLHGDVLVMLHGDNNTHHGSPWPAPARSSSSRRSRRRA
jgi:hypothetical protein